MASVVPTRVSNHLPSAPQFPNPPPFAPAHFHPTFPNQPNRPLPLPMRRAGCCDDCTCGSAGACPDCASSGRGSLSMASFFNGLGGLRDGIICSSCSSDSDISVFCSDYGNGTSSDYGACMTANGLNPDGSTIKNSSGSGSKSGSGSSSGGWTGFVSNLATNFLKPTVQPGMAVATPWYTTPVGLGALAIGVGALYLLFKKD